MWRFMAIPLYYFFEYTAGLSIRQVQLDGHSDRTQFFFSRLFDFLDTFSQSKRYSKEIVTAVFHSRLEHQMIIPCKIMLPSSSPPSQRSEYLTGSQVGRVTLFAATT
jgi:hypothetical protein